MKPSAHNPEKSRNRRSGLNRRWINTPYNGQERRSGADRREDHPRCNPNERNRLFVPLEEKLEKLKKLDPEKKSGGRTQNLPPKDCVTAETDYKNNAC